MAARRRLLEERIEWLDGFPHRMTIGALLKALRVITQHQLREKTETLVPKELYVDNAGWRAAAEELRKKLPVIDKSKEARRESN